LPAKGEIVIEKQELPLHQIRALCAALVFALNILLFNMMKQSESKASSDKAFHSAATSVLTSQVTVKAVCPRS